MAEAKSKKEIMDAELKRRLEEYCDTCRPGCVDAPVRPLTFAQYLPAVIISAILTVLVIWVGISYYPLS